MTPKQVLDSFSETLMQDERILSAQERSLLVTLLRHTKAAAGENSEAVRAVIASAVGETVAQRAFAVLGGSIVQKIVESGSFAADDFTTARTAYFPFGPQTPSAPHVPGDVVSPGQYPPHGPQPPGEFTFSGPHPPHPPSPGEFKPRKESVRAGMNTPGTPGTPQGPGVTPPPTTPTREPSSPLRDVPLVPPPKPTPDGPGASLRPLDQPRRTREVASTAVAERPSSLPAQSVVLDEFLAPQELTELMQFTLDHEPDFKTSEVLSPVAGEGVVNYEHRRSRVLMNLEHHQDLILDRIKGVLPAVLRKLGMEEFVIANVEAQITASNDGDYFHFHSDNGNSQVSSRYLTFVYFFHREPRAFEGGELRIHDARLEGDEYVSEGTYQTIVPQQNQIVFFPCEMMHEITPVRCASQLFADSRFTLNGWLRR